MDIQEQYLSFSKIYSYISCSTWLKEYERIFNTLFEKRSVFGWTIILPQVTVPYGNQTWTVAAAAALAREEAEEERER